jgi:dolichol-phosphate mannosyltransferase
LNAIVVIPTYNERQNISELIPAIQKAAPEMHILVVDDNSPDGTGHAVLDLAAGQGQKISLISPELGRYQRPFNRCPIFDFLVAR